MSWSVFIHIPPPSYSSTFIISHFPGRSSLWSAEESVFLIPSLTREMLNMVVACTVSNSEGSGSDTIKIDVACELLILDIELSISTWLSDIFYKKIVADGPSHVTISGTKTGTLGQTMQLACLAQSNPPANIIWYRGPKRQVKKILNICFDIEIFILIWLWSI